MMSNLQNFVNNLIAYSIIFSKTQRLENPEDILKWDDDVLPNLSEKTSVSTNNLTALIDEKSIKVLQKLDNNNATTAEHPILPLLLAYEYNTTRYFSLQNVLSKYPFPASDLWVLYDTIQNINNLNRAPHGYSYAIVSNLLTSQNLPIILDYLPNTDQRRAYEQAKLRLQKGL